VTPSSYGTPSQGNDVIAQVTLRINMTIDKQTLEPSNAGMRYFANIKGTMVEVTHIAMTMDTTDAILTHIDGVIAYTIHDANSGDVIANMMGAKRTGNVAYSGEHVKDMNTDALTFAPLYVESDGGLYQVQTLALKATLVNDIMAQHEALALIDTIKATDETPEIFVLASTRRGYKA
jgi:hypothetical protein